MVHDLRTIACLALWVASLCVLVHGAMFAWLLKDGLGPGVVES
jgi:hypothetical protein